MTTQSNAATVATVRAMVNECEAAGALKERARISAIMQCDEATFRGSDALKIALHSNMTLTQARAALAAEPGMKLEMTALRVSAAAAVLDFVAPKKARAI